MSVKTVATNAADPIVTALRSVPTRYRKLTYTTIALLLAGFGIWQAAEGNWGVFALGVVTAISSAMSRVNTSPPDTVTIVEDTDDDEPQSEFYPEEVDPELKALLGTDDIATALEPLEPPRDEIV